MKGREAPTPQATPIATSNPLFGLPGGDAGIKGSGASPAPRTPPAGQLEYHNVQYGFSLFYPQKLSVKRYDDRGATTLVFQSVDPPEGFQVFVVPYSGTTVSAQRFAMDEPSGERVNPRYGTIDGANVATFYSTSQTLGDTYEVWFIHGGYLYEVTTLKPLDTWLQSIMQTWQFI